METLYDNSGKPVAYLQDDNIHIYLFDGTPVAYFKEEHVYNYRGRYLGWKENGWYYDRNGNPTFFTESASGGPVKPVKQVKSVKGVKQVKPVKSVKEVRPVRPVRSLTWSRLVNREFFNQ
jgi:hypothetical protein